MLVIVENPGDVKGVIVKHLENITPSLAKLSTAAVVLKPELNNFIIF